MKRNVTLFCMLFAIAASLFTTTAKAQVNVNDSLALVDFYNSTGGPNWSYHTNWLTTAPVSTWDGVGVFENRVVDLEMWDNNLSGTIPSSIGNLTQLNTIILQNNPLLSGAIPTEIGNLVNLTYLIAMGNQLSGAIPASIGNLVNLIGLEISGNLLSGPIPVSIANCKKLTILWLHYNQLSGAIPPEIGNLPNLNDLSLGNNLLSGAIPTEIGNLVSLTALYLNDNQLSGSIPASISNLVNLQVLNISHNQLTGSIPDGIGNSTHLSHLILNNNQLSGAIPTYFDKYKNLFDIDLSYNKLTQFGESNVPISKKYATVCLNHNLLLFDGLQVVANKLPNTKYAPQDTILPIHQNGNTLSVYAGGSLGNNTYKWHQVGSTAIIIIKKDSTFTPQQSGKYYVKVKNRVANQLILRSDTIDFTLSPLKQSINTIIAKTIQPATVIKHMQAYPNPAKDVVHVQINGTAIITISNSAGKVLLTKSINNNAEINVSALAPGFYYLQNKASGEAQKIVVVH